MLLVIRPLLLPELPQEAKYNLSKVTWMEFEFEFVCLQSVSSDHGNDLTCAFRSPHSQNETEPESSLHLFDSRMLEAFKIISSNIPLSRWGN